MGLERQIHIADETPVPWPAVRARLLDLCEAPAMRMIDGELALPDDEPPVAWQELRVSLRGGMVTIRRSEVGVATVVWGNADAGLTRSWDLLNWAIASSVGGMIAHENHTMPPDEFAARMKLFPV